MSCVYCIACDLSEICAGNFVGTATNWDAAAICQDSPDVCTSRVEPGACQ
jgi:hypothetical protein